MEEGEEFASASEDSAVPAFPPLQRCCPLFVLNLCVKKPSEGSSVSPLGWELEARLCPGAESDARLPAGTVPSPLAEGSSSPVASAGVEGGSQVSPGPCSQRVSLSRPWRAARAAAGLQGCWHREDGAGRQAQPEIQSASPSPFPHPEQ